MLVATVYETSQNFFFYDTIGANAVPHDFTPTIIIGFARISIPSQKIELNLARGVWDLLVVLKNRSCYFCSDRGKARPAMRCNLFLYEPGIAV